MATPTELLAQSLAKLQSANRIDGNRNSYRKDMPAEYTVVMAYLNGGVRPTAVTSDMGMGLMLEEDARRALGVVVEPPPDPDPPPDLDPPPVGNCTQTISSGLQSAIQNAAPGAVICLNAGNYGTLTLAGVSKTSDVTIKPVAGAQVTIGLMRLNNVDHLHFTGSGGTMNIAGMEMDSGFYGGGGSDHMTFDHINWTVGMDIWTFGSANVANVIDSCTLNNLGVSPENNEGRVTFRGSYESTDSGWTLSNCSFSGGYSDGVQFIAGSRGVTIGPGNVFSSIIQSGSAHVDPIQVYDAGPVTIVGNWLKGNSTAIMGGDGGGTGSHVYNNVLWSTGASQVLYGGGNRNWLIEHNVIYMPSGVSNANHLFLGTGNAGKAASGNVVRDNVFHNGRILYTPQSGWGTHDHNLNSSQSGTGEINGTPVFVGGANPTTYEGFKLAPGSPGKGAGSNGSDMGIQ